MQEKRMRDLKLQDFLYTNTGLRNAEPAIRICFPVLIFKSCIFKSCILALNFWSRFFGLAFLVDPLAVTAVSYW